MNSVFEAGSQVDVMESLKGMGGKVLSEDLVENYNLIKTQRKFVNMETWVTLVLVTCVKLSVKAVKLVSIKGLSLTKGY